MQITETNSVSAVYSSKMLLKQIDDFSALLENIESREALKNFIQADFIEFCNYYITLCNQENNRINEDVEIDDKEIYLLHYALPNIFKETFILYRDVFLQLQIAKNKELEGVVSKKASGLHFDASKKILIQVTHSLGEKIREERTAIYKSEKNGKKLLNTIKHRTNPWVIYEKQFENLKKQVREIENSEGPMSKTIKTFEDIKNHNEFFLDKVGTDSEQILSLIEKTITSVSEMTEISQISKLVSWVDQTISSITLKSDMKDDYTSILEQKIKFLSAATIPISTSNGVLFTRNVDFNKAVKKWFDFEIFPDFMDIWEKKANMTTYAKHSLLNLKSSLLIEKNNDSLDAMPSQLQTLRNIHHTLSTNTTELNELVGYIREIIDKQFLATLIYSDQDFLEVSLQSSINQFASGQGNLVYSIKNKIVDRFSRFNSKYEASALFNTQSTVEKSIQCINHRMFKEKNAHYDTLFLNKSFIGDLFIIPREEQEQSVIKAIEQWESGFAKAILINGSALCGKTTFLEYIANKHFKKEAILLYPSSNFTFAGRKFKTSKNLEEALQNIKKGLSGSKVFLVIDNLEFWRDDNYSLLSNTRALLRFIETQSDDVMVVTSTTKQLQKRLDKRIRFSQTFSTLIDLNRSTFDEIYKAFLLRHGASHKTLVTKERETFSNRQIEREVLKLVKSHHYNIGEVLQAWTYGTTMIEDNLVVYDDLDYIFEDFFNDEEIIILKYIMLYKYINEVFLKGFVGQHLKNEFNSSLKRLVNLKVLLRNESGQLYLNNVLTNDIKRILIYRGTFN